MQKVVWKEALERRTKLFHTVCNGTVEVIVTGYSGGQRRVFRKGLGKITVGKSIGVMQHRSPNATFRVSGMQITKAES